MVKLILVLFVALVVAGALMAVDAGNGVGNRFSDAAACAEARGLVGAPAAGYDFGAFVGDVAQAAGCAVNGQ